MDTPAIDDLITLNRAATVARLLAGVAHEVNNALLVISGTAELLEGPSPSPEFLAQGLARIRGQSARAAATISEVLTFARDSPEGTGKVNLRETASQSVALRSYAIGRAGLKVHLGAPVDRALVIRGNRVLLLQALVNLITNAEQAMAALPGGEIRIELNAGSGHATVRVTDAGPGIPHDQRARIFEPFVTTRDRLQGSGLGLFAARRIAELHGGSLTLDDATSNASFVLELPLL